MHIIRQLGKQRLGRRNKLDRRRLLTAETTVRDNAVRFSD